jgi:hypothetical protein
MSFKAIKNYVIKLYAVVIIVVASSSSSAAMHTIGNSNFTFYFGEDPVDSADDVSGTFDDSKLCSDVKCTHSGSMSLASNTTFFGMLWTLHDTRVFTEGTYTFDTNCTGAQISAGITDCGGGVPLTLIVGPGQLGLHGLWDWGTAAKDMDVAIVWNLFDTFPTSGSQVWNLASTDGNGDGAPGIPMVDGPFIGASIVYNLNMDPPFDLSGVSVAIDVIGGTTQECTETGGSIVTITAETTLFGDEELASIEWTIDGSNVDFGETITPFLELNSHTIEVMATTISGSTSTDALTINVADTSSPTVNVAFLDSRTGDPINVINSNKMHFVTTSFSATDVCDTNPMSEGGVTAFAVESGDTIKIQRNKDTIQLETSTLELSVTATDASGNANTEKAILSISD